MIFLELKVYTDFSITFCIYYKVDIKFIGFIIHKTYINL
jgi:hypothetical protein